MHGVPPVLKWVTGIASDTVTVCANLGRGHYSKMGDATYVELVLFTPSACSWIAIEEVTFYDEASAQEYHTTWIFVPRHAENGSGEDPDLTDDGVSQCYCRA